MVAAMSFQPHGVGDLADGRRGIQVGNDDRLQQRRHLRHYLGVLRQAVDRLAVVPVAIDADQHLGLDLAEAVEHALDAEIRRGRRPDGAERGGRQHGDQRFRQVGQVAGDAVALADPGGDQELLEAGDLGVEFDARHPPPDPVLTPKHQGVAVIAPLQQVFGVVQPGFRKPAGAGHFVAVDEDFRAFFTDGAAKIPQR